MSVIVTCANGHRLSVRDSRAGTVGHCPACGVEVRVPTQKTKPPSDSSILRILGIGQELRKRLDESEDVADLDATATDAKKSKVAAPTKKICPQCDWEIDAGYKICPKCRYYFMR